MISLWGMSCWPLNIIRWQEMAGGLKLADDAGGKIFQLLLVCGRERVGVLKTEKETNFAFADMEPMLRVKVGFIAKAGYRGWRAIKHLQSGEEIGGGGRRGIHVCSEPESTRLMILGCVMAIGSLGGVCVRAGSDALLWGVVGLS